MSEAAKELGALIGAVAKQDPSGKLARCVREAEGCARWKVQTAVIAASANGMANVHGVQEALELIDKVYPQVMNGVMETMIAMIEGLEEGLGE